MVLQLRSILAMQAASILCAGMSLAADHCPHDALKKLLQASSRTGSNELRVPDHFHEIVAIGVERHSFNHLPPGIEAHPPSAQDAIAYESSSGHSGYPVVKITVKNDPRYTQPYAAERTPTDPIRAEFSTLEAPETSYQEGDRRAYAISFMLDPEWQADRLESPDIFTQFKRTGGQPDAFLAIKGSDVVLRVGRDKQFTVVKDVPRGSWIDLLMVVNWSKGNAGKFEVGYSTSPVRENYTRVVAYSGPNMDPRPGKTYLKFGIYKPRRFEKPPYPQQHVLYLSNFAIYK